MTHPRSHEVLGRARSTTKVCPAPSQTVFLCWLYFHVGLQCAHSLESWRGGVSCTQTLWLQTGGAEVPPQESGVLDR